MNKLTYFILGFLTCLLPLCFMVGVDYYNPNHEFSEPETILIEETPQVVEIYVPEVKNETTIELYQNETLLIDNDIALILKSHDFNSWSEEEKELIVQMMLATSRGEQISYKILNRAPDRVLELYLDLLEHAGYV